MTAPPPSDRLQLSAPTRQVFLDGRPVAIGCRAFDVLHALVERRERIVPKDELLDIAWPDVVVEENNLQVQVSALRKALGQDIVRTFPGRGYQFGSQVDETAHAASPARAEVPITPQTLPHPLTSFVGREGDLVRHAGLLEGSRLVTLTGIGGCGKTRLAIELARHVASRYRDGVCFVDLSALGADADVGSTLLAALGHPGAADALLEDLLAARQLLVVLDNCENVLASCAALLPRLLGRAPDVAVLATSREPLGVPGEHVVSVRALSVPPPDGSDVAGLESSESVRLFVDRVRSFVPAFAVDRGNCAALCELCRRLDGIPLAIELAAARAKLLSLEQICALLDQRFRLLVGGASVLPRHRMLDAVIAWTYDHLSDRERRAARRLAVFAGGWTLDAAAAVADADDDRAGTVALLDRLVDMSVVRVDRPDSGPPRYAMLETVRHFMEQRLVEAGEHDSARTQHLHFFVARAEAIDGEFATRLEADPETFPARRGEILQQFAVERQNLIKAHDWCDVAEDGPALGLRIVNAVRMYWLIPQVTATSNDRLEVVGQGYQMVQQALSRIQPSRRDAQTCRAWLTASRLSSFSHRLEDARLQLEQSLAIASELGDPSLTWRCVADLATVCRMLGDWPSACRYAEEALQLARASEKMPRIADGLFLVGVNGYAATGDYSTARRHLEEAIEVAFAAKRLADVSTYHMHVAIMAIGEGRLEEARLALLRASEISIETCAAEWTRGVVELTASLAAATRDWEASARYSGASDQLATTMGASRDAEDRAFAAPWTQLTREALGADRFDGAQAAGRSLRLGEAAAEVRSWLAGLRTR